VRLKYQGGVVGSSRLAGRCAGRQISRRHTVVLRELRCALHGAGRQRRVGEDHPFWDHVRRGRKRDLIRQSDDTRYDRRTPNNPAVVLIESYGFHRVSPEGTTTPRCRHFSRRVCIGGPVCTRASSSPNCLADVGQTLIVIFPAA
jgi:hypothetical protein